MNYAVVVIEVESDTPGIVASFGDFVEYGDAVAFADKLAHEYGIDRNHVQVTRLAHPDDAEVYLAG